jgi:hypothetical protein
VEYGNRIFVFHLGRGQDQLWNATFDSNNWLGDWSLNNGITLSPSAAVCCGVLYVFYQQQGNTRCLRF